MIEQYTRSAVHKFSDDTREKKKRKKNQKAELKMFFDPVEICQFQSLHLLRQKPSLLRSRFQFPGIKSNPE